MNLELLDKILELSSLYKIHKSIKRAGFRLTNYYDRHEFDLNTNLITNGVSIARKTGSSNLLYFATFYESVQKYKGASFIRLDIYSTDDGYIPEIPTKVFVYTTAPVNNKFKQANSKILPCAICGQTHLRGNLIKDNNKNLICISCLVKKITSNNPFITERE